VAPFKIDRMTWIKPSFLWMMYRSGWATKPGQERVLAIDITRSGFDWALRNSCLSAFDGTLHDSQEQWSERLSASPVRIQWDPERDLALRPLPHRSIQIGISGIAVRQYVQEWITGITDCTDLAHEIRALVAAGKKDAATELLPPMNDYPAGPDIRGVIGSTG
jgi:hypothetical protein